MAPTLRLLYLLLFLLPLPPDDRWDGAELDQALDLVDKLEEKAEEQPERLEKLEKDRVRDTGMTRPTLLDDRQIATVSVGIGFTLVVVVVVS